MKRSLFACSALLLTTLPSLVLAQGEQVGRIQGGWEFVWASYGIAWGGMALYALSLWLRRPGRHDPDVSERERA